MEMHTVVQEVSAKPRKLSKKAIEGLIAESFRKHANYIQIPVMDIPKIYHWARNAVVNGEDLDTEMQRAIRMYRVN